MSVSTLSPSKSSRTKLTGQNPILCGFLEALGFDPDYIIGVELSSYAECPLELVITGCAANDDPAQPFRCVDTRYEITIPDDRIKFDGYDERCRARIDGYRKAFERFGMVAVEQS